MKIQNIFFLLQLLLLIKVSYQGISTTECNTLHYFNSVNLKCQTCPSTNQISVNNSQCVCKQNYEKDPTKQSFIGWNSPSICVECILPRVCSCKGSNQKLVRYNLDGSLLDSPICVQCVDTSYADPDYPWCKPCPHFSQVYNPQTLKCECSSQQGYYSSGDTCILSSNMQAVGTSVQTDNLPLAKTIVYSNIKNSVEKIVSSAILNQYYLSSSVTCIQYKDTQNCQIFANLCVLQLYNMKTLRLYSPNFLFLKGEHISGKLITLTQQTTRGDLRAQFTFDTKVSSSSTKTNYLDIYTAIYDIKGNLLDFRPMQGELQLCSHTIEDLKKWRQFGTNFMNNCELNLDQFISNYNSYFYEVFIKDVSSIYYDIPVLITNYKDENGYQPNNQPDSNQFVYVKRFQIVDNLGSIPGNQYPPQVATNPTVIRYASQITLKVSLQEGNPDKIQIPILIINYDEKLVDQGKVTNPTALISYRTQYLYTPDVFWIVAQVFLILFLIACKLKIIIKRLRLWRKYNPEDVVKVVDTNYYLQFAIAILHSVTETVSLAMFIFLFIFTGYWFVFYKLQSKAYVLLPSQEEAFTAQYKPFLDLFYTMFAFSIVSTFLLIKKQCEVDVFFIDWERQQQFVDNEDQIRGVSIWRTLFIANEFNELSINRIISLEWTLMIVGFFLAGLQWENLSAETPLVTTSVHNIKQNFILKYFLATFLFVIIGLVQIVFKKIEVLYIRDIQNYMDLCSVANISIFILDHDLHGYYIHGKNPTLAAEGNSYWIQESIEKQAERKLQRGPEINNRNPGESDTAIEQNQIYEIIIPKQMREMYEVQNKVKQTQQDILKQLRMKEEKDKELIMKQKQNLNPEQDHPEMEQLKNDISNKEKQLEKVRISNPNSLILSEVGETKRKLANYLKLAITEVIIHRNETISEKNALHRWFGFPGKEIEMNTSKSARNLPLFFRDAGEYKDFSIESIFFAGQEYKLFCFDIFVYNFFDIVTGSTLIAIVLTYIIDKFLTKLREDMGQNNIANKTLISEKFLI